MAKKIDYAISKKVGDEWGCLESPEELKVWTARHGWKEGFFSTNKLRISCISVKSSKTIGATSKTVYNRRAPLVLSNGFEITEGSSGLTSQNKTASYPSLKVDSIKEFNDVMKILTEKEELDIWEATSFSFWNEKHRAKIRFSKFSPNSGTPTGLYLDRVWDDSGERPYCQITYYDQLEFCNYFSNTTAACVKREGTFVDCGIKILEEMGRAG